MLIKVGQEVFVRQAVYRHRETPRTGFETVTRVGKKYFYTASGAYGRETKYDLQTMVEVNDTNYKAVAYLKEQDYLDELEGLKLQEDIKKLIGTYGIGMRDFSLSKLRKIKQLVEEE